MHFYFVFEGLQMVVGGFWLLAATSTKGLEGSRSSLFILQTEKTVFPQF